MNNYPKLLSSNTLLLTGTTSLMYMVLLAVSWWKRKIGLNCFNAGMWKWGALIANHIEL